MSDLERESATDLAIERIKVFREFIQSITCGNYLVHDPQTLVMSLMQACQRSDSKPLRVGAFTILNAIGAGLTSSVLLENEAFEEKQAPKKDFTKRAIFMLNGI